MKPAKTILLTGAMIAALPLTGLARKPPTITGKVVAYDPLLHAAKAATYGSNREEVILQTPAQKFIKLVFVGFGTTQIEAKYFDGTQLLTAHALRDKSCDDKSPVIVSEVALHQKAGTFLLTDAFKSSPPKIKTLECYDATEEKK